MALPRILTTLILIPIVIGAIWVGSLPFFFLVSGVCLLSLWEYSLMAEEGGYPNQFALSLAGGAAVLLALYLDGVPWGPLRRAPSVLFILILWVFASFIREFFRGDKGHSYLRVITALAGVLWCALLLGHLLLIRDLRFVAGEGFQLIGRKIVFFLFVTVWTLDTASWLVGRMFGRTPLAPNLSPKKTWEGALAGTLLACAVGWFFREAFLREQLGGLEAALYALVIAVTAQMSDLIESLIKRSFGVKDSSQLLPGHGGLLDRFDSFIFAAPFFYYVLIGSGRFQ